MKHEVFLADKGHGLLSAGLNWFGQMEIIISLWICFVCRQSNVSLATEAESQLLKGW